MDRHSDSTGFSPIPFSPFSSNNSMGSEGGTSDEPADLGQLAAVFEVFRTEFQPRSQPQVLRAPDGGTPTSSLMVSPSDGEEDSRSAWSASGGITYSDSEEDYGRPSSIHAHGESLDQPSLGYLDDVLGFLAAERAKFTAQREAGLRGGMSSQASTSESAWRHVIEPRRKRRRKRAGGGTKIQASSVSGSTSMTNVDNDNDLDADADAEGVMTPVGGDVHELDGSSSGEYWVHGAGKSMPSTPPKSRRLRALNGKGKRKEESTTVVIPGTSQKITVQPKLTHSRSTPSLRVTIPSPPDARVLQLRTLATKLRLLFDEDSKTLSSVLLNDGPEEDGFIDPRGRPANDEDPLIHVFIDHSNILIGFLNYLRRFPLHSHHRAKTHLSHAALSLILERGRPISRRVLATSSPLYQPMDSAERLGYEVRVYARVPDLGDGMDRAAREGMRNGSKRNSSVPRTGAPQGNASADSDPGPPGAPLPAPPVSAGSKGHGHSRSSSLNIPGPNARGFVSSAKHGGLPGGSNAGPGMNGPGPSTRVRYREQGVDELLQLKLHQAIADADSPPPKGSTIVLATGDGNVGQFNADGFLGAVRTALRKGWRVELYAWEFGLSKAWVKEFGGGGAGEESSGPSLYGDRFRIVGLEKFAHDLLEVH